LDLCAARELIGRSPAEVWRLSARESLEDDAAKEVTMPRDALLIVDVLDDFSQEHGDDLLASLARCHEDLAGVIRSARDSGTPIVFANDNKGVWDGNVERLVIRALDGPGGELVRELVPRAGDRFVIKPRYSAFDHTPLGLILAELQCERLLIAGMTTESCVAQSAIAALELGLRVTVIANACATVDPRNASTALRYLVDVVGVHVSDDAGQV
jgi:nicotinamidase-related amidase